MFENSPLFPVEIEQTQTLTIVGRRNPRVRARVLAKFYSQISDLLQSGVPLLRSLSILQRQSISPRLSEVLEDIHRRVADGATLADAMAEHERLFGELAVSMVRAGQEGGFLEDVFKRISIFTDRQEDLRGKIIGAVAYPIVLLSIGTVIVSVLLVYFVPKFALIFDRLRERGELPWATEALLSTSQTLQSYGLYILGGVVLLVIYLNRQAGTPGGRRLIDAWKLKLPVAGNVFRDLGHHTFQSRLGYLATQRRPPALLLAHRQGLHGECAHEGSHRARGGKRQGGRQTGNTVAGFRLFSPRDRRDDRCCRERATRLRPY